MIKIQKLIQKVLKNYLINHKNPKQSIINHLYKLGYDKFYCLLFTKLACLWLYNSKTFRIVIRTSFVIFSIYILGIITMNFKVLDKDIELKLINNKLESYIKALNSNESKINNIEKHIKSFEYTRLKYQNISGVPIPREIDSIGLITIANTAHFYNIPERLFFRLIYYESNFRPSVVSHKNAFGYGQILKSTFILYKLDNLYNFENPIHNIKASGYIIYKLHKKYKRWDLTLAAYNGGDGVIKNNQICNCKEIKKYVEFITK